MNSVKKILGLILFFGGLAVILYGLYSSYNIFTAKEPPPEIFRVEEKVVQKGGPQDTQAQLQGLLQEQLKGMLPAGSLPGLMNLISWSIFAGILTFSGGQIAGLGIKLIK